jgi:hypothetical protein
MSSSTVVEIKKELIAAGFEVYRTRGDEVQVADRVRDNLIMDSGVSIHGGPALRVQIVVRAERCDFPSDVPESLFDRARTLGAGAVVRGFAETGTRTNPMHDPTDPSRTLDTWYEVVFEKAVPTLSDAIEEVRFAVTVEKVAGNQPPSARGWPKDGER